MKMPSMRDSCPKAGATVVRSSWPGRVVFIVVSGRMVALGQHWATGRCTPGVGRADWSLWRAEAYRPRRAARGRVSTAAAPPRSGSAAIVRGLARGGRVHASQASPHRMRARKVLHARICGLFGFWPHFVCDRFFFACAAADRHASIL